MKRIQVLEPGGPEAMVTASARRTVEKTAAVPPWKTLRVSHFPTVSAAAGD